ncbi:cysteine hydrolase family protein [Rummeliibacillus sp. JY-2-4R]
MDKYADTLIVIDLQNGVCNGSESLFDLDNLLKRVNNRISLYRELEKPIIFVQHQDEELIPGDDLWKINTGIDFREQDYFISKTHANSFYKTNLKNLLDQLSIQSIEFSGAQTEYCIDATVKFSHGLGYKNFMVHRATSTLGNSFMSAAETIEFYEKLWNRRFLEFIES